MNYIVKFHNEDLSYSAMYMIAPGHWTPIFNKATINESSEAARNLVHQQYQALNHAWVHITILKYTDREYFKAVLKND